MTLVSFVSVGGAYIVVRRLILSQIEVYFFVFYVCTIRLHDRK